MNELEPGLLIPVEYIRTIDGDTVELQIRRRFNVRLRDIDVYEKDTELGKEASEYVDTILGFSKDILIFIPTNDPIKLLDWNSFERAVADVFVNGKNLAELLRSKNFEKK